MGRPRKPTELKILEGAQPCRINRSQPVPPKGAGPCPDHLDDLGREAWSRITARLEEMGVLTMADGEAIALYASIYSRWRGAVDEVESDGLTLTSSTVTKTAKGETTRKATKAHPLIAVVNESQAQMTRLLGLFGMTPSSRSSLHVQAEAKADPVLDFLAKAGGKRRGGSRP